MIEAFGETIWSTNIFWSFQISNDNLCHSLGIYPPIRMLFVGTVQMPFKTEHEQKLGTKY